MTHYEIVVEVPEGANLTAIRRRLRECLQLWTFTGAGYARVKVMSIKRLRS